MCVNPFSNRDGCVECQVVHFVVITVDLLDNQLVTEMKKRGFNPNPKRQFPKEIFLPNLYNDWNPSLKDKKIIIKRIDEKIRMKPNWYKKTKYK